MKKLSTINYQLLTIPRRGYIALTSFLIISAFALAISVALALFGVSELQMSLAEYRGSRAIALAEGCADDALLSAYYDADYGGGAETYPEGSCSVGITKNGNDWTIVTAAVVSGHTRRVEVKMTRGDEIVITGWKEIE